MSAKSFPLCPMTQPSQQPSYLHILPTLNGGDFVEYVPHESGISGAVLELLITERV